MIQRFLIIIALAVGCAGLALAQDAPTHTVRQGETLYRIATTNGMTVDELKRLNDLQGNVIHVGQVLRLSPASEAETDDTPADDQSIEADVSVPEDVDERPSDDPGVDVALTPSGDPDFDEVPPSDDADLAPTGDQDVEAAVPPSGDEEADMGVSPLGGRDVEAGDSTAPGDALDDAAALVARGVTSHVARQGETLYSIAEDRGTKAYILFTLNNGIRAPLEPGTPLVVPASMGPGTYVVKRGDTLFKIARDQGTTLAALRRVNALESDALEVGQTLTIPGASAGDVPMQGGTQTYAVGSVTVFPETYAGRVMAGGAAYAPDEFVVAHRELPFDTVLIVENAETGRASFARVADRGPVDTRRFMEISPALATEIGVEPDGQVRVRLVE